MALFESKVAKHGFVAAWILGGIARQIGFDAKGGALNAKNLFRSWMKQRWQRVPRPIRKVAFGIGVSARAAYRGARHSDRTLRRGVQQGIVEGQHRHREWQELREMQREFPGRRDHPHYTETLERIQADRLNRFFEHQRHAAEVRQAAREKKAAPAPPEPPKPVAPEIPTQPTVSDPVVAPKTNGQIPVHPGEPTVQGDYRTVYTAADGTQQVFAGRTEEHARGEAAWWEWRKDKPGGLGGSVTTEPMPGSVLPATNGHVVSSGCSHCAHNH
jgi:hypothetical protein